MSLGIHQPMTYKAFLQLLFEFVARYHVYRTIYYSRYVSCFTLTSGGVFHPPLLEVTFCYLKGWETLVSPHIDYLVSVIKDETDIVQGLDVLFVQFRLYNFVATLVASRSREQDVVMDVVLD